MESGVSALAAYAADVGPLAYVWPVLMLATLLATGAGVAFMAWRERDAYECDTRHTVNGYSAARQPASVGTSTKASSPAPSRTETE